MAAVEPSVSMTTSRADDPSIEVYADKPTRPVRAAIRPETRTHVEHVDCQKSNRWLELLLRRLIEVPSALSSQFVKVGEAGVTCSLLFYVRGDQRRHEMSIAPAIELSVRLRIGRALCGDPADK